MELSPKLPRYRAILAVDIEKSTARNNGAKVRLRRAMYELVEKSFVIGGIAKDYRDSFVDRGDGLLSLIHPVDQIPKTLLLNPVVPAMSVLLARHNARDPDNAFRIRVVVHAGEVHYDTNAPFGESLDTACRLLDAPDVKLTLRDTSAPLVLVVSDHIYRTVVWQGYEGIDHRRYEPFVHVRGRGAPHVGWLHVPGECPADAARRTRAADPMLTPYPLSWNAKRPSSADAVGC